MGWSKKEISATYFENNKLYFFYNLFSWQCLCHDKDLGQTSLNVNPLSSRRKEKKR